MGQGIWKDIKYLKTLFGVFNIISLVIADIATSCSITYGCNQKLFANCQ